MTHSEDGWSPRITNTRHAELGSASTAPLRHSSIESQPNSKIDPIGIVALDEVDLPFAPPALELLLPRNGIEHRFEHLVADQMADIVP